MLVRIDIATSINAVVRGDKSRKEYALVLQRHRAAILIQKQLKVRIGWRKLKSMHDASIVIQSGNNIRVLNLSNQFL